MKLYTKILSLSAGLGLALNLAVASNVNQLQIKQISVGPQSGDKASNFSLDIVLINNYKTLANWQFGFYMPRNFRQIKQSNAQLIMKICDVANRCSNLLYQKAKFSATDLSTVFTTIVKPELNYPLQKGQKYQISLQHNSSQGPHNYSALPQNFFITADDNLINLPTTPANYNITGLDFKHTRQQLQQRIRTNWLNSIPLQTTINVVPLPTQLNILANQPPFKLPDKVVIYNEAGLSAAQVELWQQALASDLDAASTVVSGDKDLKEAEVAIILHKVANSQMNSPEGYQLNINQQRLTISASHAAGFFYALQTLRQLWFNGQQIPALTITDTPKFKYRGILLDVARHYFSVEQLKNFIELMAASKLNTLHLHLSDDEAFRLELADYPALTKQGAKRGYSYPIGPLAFLQKNLTKMAADEPAVYADTEYTGSYSQSQIEDLIKYANERQITIIPELDIPGHARAMMKAMPDTFYEVDDNSQYGGYGDNSLPVCAYASNSNFGKRFTTALNAILNSTAALFANQSTLYAISHEISIGGDEVFDGTWNEAPSCQVAPWESMSELDKEHYFLNSLGADAKMDKLKLSGWHEFVLRKNGKLNNQHGLRASEVGHVWVWGKARESLAKAVTLANAGYSVVIEYSDYLYMDMTYSAAVEEPGFYWATQYGDTYTLLNAAQVVNKTLKQVKDKEQVLGLEAALWTDVIPSYTHLQYMAIPKLAGLAEAAWSAASYTAALPNWRSLASRLGCGKNGYLAYLNAKFNVIYRGYPNGIQLEAPQICN